MNNFIQLEGGYLLIGLFALGVAIFVGTRPFISNGNAWKKTVPITLGVILIFVFGHYIMTTNRMAKVQKRFNNGGAVICESKALRKVSQSIIIDKSKNNTWVLQNDMFVSPEYVRGFYSARCLEYYYPKH